MKGQWFIISAVVASSIFLSLSFLLKDYFVVDSSSAVASNDFYFNSITNQLDRIVENAATTAADCRNLTTGLNEFETIAEKELASKGLLLSLEYSIVQCSPNTVNFDFLVASDKGIIYNFTTRKSPSEIIG